MTTHCSTLAWRIPWTEEPGGLQPTGSQKSQTQLGTKTTPRGADSTDPTHCRLLPAHTEMTGRRGRRVDSQADVAMSWRLSVRILSKQQR